MSKYFWYGIIEDIDTVRRIPIGRFWGVTLLVTPLTWLGPFVFFGVNILLNALNSRISLADRLYQALLFMIAVETTTLLHAFGHILSGKLVRSPMDELLITATRDINLYHGDQSRIPGYVHLVRSIGGPIFNVFVAGICALIATRVAPGFWSSFITGLVATNLFFGLGGLLPLPSIDGAVIWRELLKPLYSPK